MGYENGYPWELIDHGNPWEFSDVLDELKFSRVTTWLDRISFKRLVVMTLNSSTRQEWRSGRFPLNSWLSWRKTPWTPHFVTMSSISSVRSKLEPRCGNFPGGLRSGPRDNHLGGGSALDAGAVGPGSWKVPWPWSMAMENGWKMDGKWMENGWMENLEDSSDIICCKSGQIRWGTSLKMKVWFF